jgi:hypothetical protein
MDVIYERLLYKLFVDPNPSIGGETLKMSFLIRQHIIFLLVWFLLCYLIRKTVF